MTPSLPSKRLDSLDALRGFDMFVLVLLHPFLMALTAAAPDSAVMQFLREQSTHVTWEGFTFHDLIMPLFMFVAGVAIPFAFAKYRTGDTFTFDRRRVYGRMARRVVLLWLLGMVIQGNLLGLDPKHIYLFTNTLQAIAVGYLFASLFYIRFTWRVQAAIAAGLMVAYWAVMTFCSAEGWGMIFGNGDYAFPTNMAEYIDRVVLGRFRDGVTWEGEVWSFASWYDNTWILSSLTFVVTVMIGVFSGEMLLADGTPMRKLWRLVLFGAALLVGAWVLKAAGIPIIKRIWTPSMVLLAGGWSVLLLALFYYILDIRGWKRWAFPLRVMGLNAVVAYTMGEYFNFSSITGRLLYGFEHWLPEGWYPVVLAAGQALLIYWVIWMLYRCEKYVRL